MNRFVAVIVMVVVLVVLALFTTTYTVKYNEVAVKATFGEVDETSVVREPGLHWRLPVFIDRVTKLDTRLQYVESPIEEVATADGLQIVARGFLLWRVDEESETGPLEFFRKYQTVENAAGLISGQFRAAFTAGLGQFAFEDLIGRGSRVDEAEETIRAALAETLGPQGIVPEVVGISQIMLPPRSSRAVLERMQAERNVLANSEQQKGNAAAQQLQAEASTQADKIRAFASRLAEEIRAEGQERAATYLQQLGEDPELAIFLEWLDALKKSLDGFTTVVLPPTAEPWHLLSPGAETTSSGIPLPAEPVGVGVGGPAAVGGAGDEPSDGTPSATGS